VFTFHVVIVVPAVAIPRAGVDDGGKTGDLALTLAVVASLTLPALVYQRYVVARRSALLPSLEMPAPDEAVPQRMM
jgi:hypothetical protein